MVFLMMEIPNQLCNIVWVIFLSHCTEILNLKEQNVTPESWLHKSQFHCCVFIYSMSTSLAYWQIHSGVEQHMCHCADALGWDGCGSWVGEAEGSLQKRSYISDIICRSSLWGLKIAGQGVSAFLGSDSLTYYP